MCRHCVDLIYYRNCILVKSLGSVSIDHEVEERLTIISNKAIKGFFDK